MSDGPIPLLFLGDAPSSTSGLGRIGRDLAVIAATMPEFRVGFMGRGGVASCQLPFMQYNYPEYLPGREGGQWGEHDIEHIWHDFANSRRGVIMTIWDPSRLDWFAMPEFLPDGPLKTFLQSGRFERWGYFPIDGYGINGQLSSLQRETVKRYDRVLAYGTFGTVVIANSLRKIPSEIEWMPHGFNDAIFHPAVESRSTRDYWQVGCIMTNQVRKDWGVAFEVFADLKQRGGNWRFWCHTDSIDRYWDLRALVADFDLAAEISITFSGTMDDTLLAANYRDCDVTILPSLGEGFGYPIVESLACGVPCVRTNYAGGADLPGIDAQYSGLRLDTRHNIYRPVLSAGRFVQQILAMPYHSKPGQAVELSKSVEHLAWRNLSPTWKKWFRSEVQHA